MVRMGTFLVVQWLRLCDPNAKNPGSIPGRGTRSHMVKLPIFQEHLTGLPFPSPGDLPDPGIELASASPALAGRFFTPEPPGKPISITEL